MTHTPIDSKHRLPAMVRRVAADTPIVVGAFLAGTVALGYGIANPLVDAVGLVATGTGYEATQAAIRGARHRGDRGLD